MMIRDIGGRPEDLPDREEIGYSIEQNRVSIINLTFNNIYYISMPF